MQSIAYNNYRVRYMAPYQATPSAVKDTVNKDLWVCEDLVPAVSEEAALQQVIGRGCLPVSAKLVRAKAGAGIPADYKQKFLLAVMFSVQAGESAGAALERTIESEPWPLRGSLDPALRLLRSGAGFSEAISILGMYDETTLAILSAGEQTGTMQQSLSAALEHLQRKSSSDGLMKAAFSAILMDIFMAVSSSISSVMFMLPQAENQGLQTTDPAAIAKWEAAIHLGYVSNWILIAIAMVALMFAAGAWFGYNFGTPEARRNAEKFLRKLPFMGEALVHEALSVSTGVCSHLLKGGVLFMRAAEITAKTIRLPAVKAYWDDALAMSQGGLPVGQALSRAPLNSAECRVIASHTSSAQLAEAFHMVSTQRQQLSAKASKRFTVSGLVLSFLYSGVGIAATLYVNYVQITALMSSAST